ncbi:hypothetical protein N0V93_004906 [Gnomoniopsis smithogilvyi]|uniref:Uncharacterized protein n=1 Tax=Gnomoniopsis smithogilvyi TaxID=1191159 RepID=A0A9W8YVN9_9PEZI|nr:hypothetical protein N0V93_004906 [Gnomoniopsis smithogilvyi]
MTTQSAAMNAFLSSNPRLAIVAQQRDKDAWICLGQVMYERYEQDSLKVVALRAKAAAAGEPARSSNPRGMVKRGKRHCNTCGEDVFGFTRHNRTNHIQDPSQILFCPVGTCDFAAHSDHTTQMDDHLANAHLDFRNTAGRGGDHLENATEISILSHLNKDTALYVLSEDRLKVEAIMEEKERLLLKLQQQHGITWPALERDFSADLTPGSVDIDTSSVKKAEVVTLIIKLRREMKKWYNIFIEAEDLMEPNMKNTDFRGGHDMEDVSTEYEDSDVESVEE